MSPSLLPGDSAPQHERGPRPLPLFLQLVRQVAEREPELAQRALQGLAAYQKAQPAAAGPERPEVARAGAARLLDCGGRGPPVVLVPSLINPPSILDLDADVSLAAAVAGMDRRALLLDWGPAAGRSALDVSAHIEALLVPLIAALGEAPVLVGYCLGGTMAIAAAQTAKARALVTLAAPWQFGRYPADARAALDSIWSQARPAAEALGALPMEVLQAAFWSIDPRRTVSKFAAFAGLDPASAKARRFVALEDWANEGEPLPFPAARELMEDFFAADRPGSGGWRVGGRTISDVLGVPVLHCTAEQDRITPSLTAPAGKRAQIPAGHVGMIVGSARQRLHAALRTFLQHNPKRSS